MVVVLQGSAGINDLDQWAIIWINLENLVYHFFRQLWLVLGVKQQLVFQEWAIVWINGSMISKMRRMYGLFTFQ